MTTPRCSHGEVMHGDRGTVLCRLCGQTGYPGAAVEAVAAYRAALITAVASLPGYETPPDIEFGAEGYVYDPEGVMRAHVLDLIRTMEATDDHPA